jgi:hypothetical protein
MIQVKTICKKNAEALGKRMKDDVMVARTVPRFRAPTSTFVSPTFVCARIVCSVGGGGRIVLVGGADSVVETKQGRFDIEIWGNRSRWLQMEYRWECAYFYLEAKRDAKVGWKENRSGS